MTAFASAYVVKNASVQFTATEYANQVTKVRLVPDTAIQTVKTVDPTGVLQDVDTTTWTLELSGVQSSAPATGTGNLDDFLFDNNGLTASVTIKPKVGGRQAVVTVVCLPVPFGDEQGKYAAFDVTLPVVGQPVFT